ncbi:MAG: protein kinase [Pirellulaceae bacterium]
MNAANRSHSITRIVSECVELQKAGEIWQREKLCEANPDLLPELDYQLRALELMREVQNDPLETIDRSSKSPIDITMTAAFAGTPKQQCELQVGEKLGQYEVVRKLGQGGMGTVYEVDDTESGRRVAMKTLSHNFDSPESRERFLREGILAASINHPNSVYVYGTDEIDGIPIIVMELLRGGTLQDKLDHEGPLSVRDAVKAILNVIAGLEAAAEKGILHRDIKPANCFVDIDGTVKVGDYGLSISSEARIDPLANRVTQPGVIVGTPAFASPEQLRGEELDVRSDIYSVGATLYYLLSGRPPFGSQGQNLVQFIASVLEAPRPDIRTSRTNIPTDLVAILKRSIEIKQKARFQDYPKLRNTLMQFAGYDPPAKLSTRFLCGLEDAIVLNLFQTSVVSPILMISGLAGAAITRGSWSIAAILCSVVFYGFRVAYFTGFEAIGGCTPGKWWHGLKVRNSNNSRLSIGRAMIRSSLYVMIPYIFLWGIQSAILITPFTLDFSDAEKGALVDLVQNPGNAKAAREWGAALLRADRLVTGLAITFLASSIAYAFLFWPALLGSENLARHDLWSLSKVVSIKDGKGVSRVKFSFDGPIVFETPLRTIGPFEVTGQIATPDGSRLYVGIDPRLKRQVWIHRSNGPEKTLSETRKAVSRRERIRWIASGVEAGGRWDAFEATQGDLLCKAHTARARLLELANRQLLTDLRNELKAGQEDGTLPDGLRLSQLWIGNDGCLRVLDWPLECSLGCCNESSAELELNQPKAFMAQAGEMVAVLPRRNRVLLLVIRYLLPFLVGLSFASPIGFVIAATLTWLGFVWLPAFLCTALFGRTYVMWRLNLTVKKGKQRASRIVSLIRLLLPAIYFVLVGLAARLIYGIPGVPSALLTAIFFLAPFCVNTYLGPGPGLVDRLLGTRVVYSIPI